MKEETKEKIRDFKNKLLLLKAQIKTYFKTSDLKRKLDKEERKLQTQIKEKEDLVEFHVEQILIDEAHITSTESEIVILKKEIKQLETDVKKVVKVINLYIV